jgi:hypothetical protein
VADPFLDGHGLPDGTEHPLSRCGYALGVGTLPLSHGLMNNSAVIAISSSLFAGALLSDALLFWAGYSGRLGLFSFLLVKIACLVALLFLLVLGMYRHIRKGRYALLARSVLLVGLLCLYFAATRGEHFPMMVGMRVRLRREVNPVQLQQWAETVLTEHSPEDDMIEPRALPAFLKIPHWPLSGARIIGLENDRHVQIIWGGGFVPPCGIRVGSPQFSSEGDLVWIPGVYFYWRQ